MNASFQVLVIDRGGYFIAQSLEKHIVVQARTLEELRLYFIDTMMSYAFLDELDGVPPLSRLKGAPAEVWQQWEAAQPMSSSDPSCPYEFRRVA